RRHTRSDRDWSSDVCSSDLGTSLIMWIGEQISEKGIGNGISLIIFAGIVVRMPSALEGTYQLLRTGEMKPLVIVGVLVLMLAVKIGRASCRERGDVWVVGV